MYLFIRFILKFPIELVPIVRIFLIFCENRFMDLWKGEKAMNKGVKIFSLILLSGMLLTSAGSVYAESGMESYSAGSETDENNEEKRVLLTESKEETDISAADVKKLMNYAGECDGYEVYTKTDDETDKETQKKCGKAVIIEKSTGAVKAVFESSKKCSDGEILISKAKRFILTINDRKEPLKITELVSSIDEPLLFISSDKKTLEYMNKDYSDVQETYSYLKSQGDSEVYCNESGNKFVWLNKEKNQVFTMFEYSAENEDYRMLFDTRTALIGLENKETGYTWWSSPLDASRDMSATSAIIENLRSSSVLIYGKLESRSTATLRSSGSKCSISTENIPNGVKVTYNYTGVGISYPVEYTLEKDCLKASLKASEIMEKNSAYIAARISVLGNFGAGGSDENGYFVIPDGSGAIINFNNGKVNSAPYSQRIYGADVSAVPRKKGAVTEQVSMPVYGIVKEDNALLAVAAKGDSNAFINASVSKQSNSSYNLCGFSFVVRDTDTYYMSGNMNSELTVFEGGKIKSDDIEVRYYPVSKIDADYVDIADCYRQYLTEEKKISAVTKKNYSPLYVDLYGGVRKKKSFLGIPLNVRTSVTSFEQAKEIISNLNDSGVNDIVVSYNSWTNAGIDGKVDYKAKAAGKLGGKSEFNKFKDYINSNELELYPAVNNKSFYSGQGYYSFDSTSVRISGAYSRIISYDMAYGIKNDFKDIMSLLSPDCFNDVYSDLAENYSSMGLNGVSLGDMTTALYGDYGKNNISRYNTMNILEDCYKTIDSSLSDCILADNANAYVFPYVKHITDVPLCSSGFDVFDEDIPFYQIVIHGIIPYSSTAINGSDDPDKLLLMSAAAGSSLHFDMLYEDISELKDTDFNKYFYAKYNSWTDTAAEQYKLISAVLSKVSDCTISDYHNDDGVIETTYSDGTVIRVNLNEKNIFCNNSEYKANFVQTF